MKKFVTRIAHRSDASTSHARAFYKILTGESVPTTITKGELDMLIKEYTDEEIAAARVKYKNGRLASPYKRALLAELGIPADDFTRKDADKALQTQKYNDPEKYKAAKEKLRGFRLKRKMEMEAI